MNHASDRAQLLSDVLAETDPASFRETLLDETLRLVGRRRRIQRFRRVAATVGAVGALLLLGHRVITSSTASYAIVRTATFPTSVIVRTQALASDRIVASVATVASVRTTPVSGSFRTIDDDTLLAFVAPRPAVLVRVGPHAEKLILLTPDTRTNSRLN